MYIFYTKKIETFGQRSKIFQTENLFLFNKR
ncbi:hypothetical protein F929_02440 [Acinetobacter lactucae]|uniref:Uncharacterized protein n=1 Tax=Acinetobacter lactucae TaxID=1785128 RepID=R8YSW7_9GAMM|nr:hypothetical protein F929_02440 [Acinetobacter lactucae]